MASLVALLVGLNDICDLGFESVEISVRYFGLLIHGSQGTAIHTRIEGDA